MPRIILLFCFAAAAFATTDAWSQSDTDRAAIKKSIDTYVKAFNDQDAKSLAAHWSPEGVYISRSTGEQTTGRDALEKEFAAMFKDAKGTKLAVTSTSIDFVSPNVAIEQGKATVTRAQSTPEVTDYRVVYVRRDGKWLIDRIIEEDEPRDPPSHYEQLKQLEWLVGTWVDNEGGDRVKTDCQWSKNRNYLVRTFTATVDDRIDLSGMQIVGWDPAKKQIRSWVFDSDGGFAEGVWSKK
ncbi:MAG: SgcJ/EcaC family oxidoreductase, partial [Pirellulales bacterium]|nr:SgcJ/EcaC family oxidoreductase [Pirellulales bacterium]